MKFIEGQVPGKPLRWAMVGGGKNSEIGYIHRAAAARDSLFDLVAGVLDIDPERGREFGQSIGIDATRCYDDYRQMLLQESTREDGIQVLSIATPNSTHYEIAKAALTAGLHVICEKPVSFHAHEAKELKELADANGLILGVPHGYAGYQMLHEARHMVQTGVLGDIRIINGEFAHGYHATAVEEHSPGAKWRMNPAVSGSSYVIGDIGTHCFYNAFMVTGLETDSLSCIRQSFIKSRAPLEDNAHITLKYENGAVGTIWSSAVNIGSTHSQKLRIVGSKASIEWWDEHPNQLMFAEVDGPVQTLERGLGYLHYKDNFSRVGGGHAEGFFEAWSHMYYSFAVAIHAALKHEKTSQWYPDGYAGEIGVRFVERCVESADNDGAWVKFIS